MSRVDEISKFLGCTGSNACYLLRRIKIKGTRTSAGWEVTDDVVYGQADTYENLLNSIKKLERS